MKVETSSEAEDITAAILSGNLSLDVGEAIAESPPLHSSLTITLFETIVYLFDWFSSHPSLSKEAFSKNLKLWHSILPEGNLLPTSYQEAYRIIKPYLVPEIVYHVCVNDCLLFRGEHKDSVACPECGEQRFRTKNIARRTFHYLPLGPRLVRSFGTKEISHLLQSHGGEIGTQGNGEVMRDIHDSSKWKEAFHVTGTYGGDPRGVALSLCLDGLNPWSKNKCNYSMWPIVLGQLNLPRRIRYLLSNLLLVRIIPSQAQGKEPKHLDPYLEVLVDELLFLSSCKLFDSYHNAPFQAKVEIMIYILDYQGLGKVFCLSGTGSYRGCAWCMLKGVYCKHLSKVVYPGNRRFLTKDHPLRQDSFNFPDRSEEKRERPPYRRYLQDLSFRKAHDDAKNNAQNSRVATGTGCHGMHILAKKNPSFDRVEQTMPDAMHTVAVQVKHLVKRIAGKSPEDSLAVRLQEKSLGRFEESWPKSSAAGPSKSSENDNEGSKQQKKTKKEAATLPHAPFGLTKKQMEVADQRAKDIKVPAGDTFRPGAIFSRVSRLNSHEWKEVHVNFCKSAAPTLYMQSNMYIVYVIQSCQSGMETLPVGRGPKLQQNGVCSFFSLLQN